ncbi:hypothetical protein BC833DRAFT_626307 [Globomyces pollinis-pini]|nr:hypothetical protein BC833DRAFT_626307 [Globomyces pollinis-pini]
MRLPHTDLRLPGNRTSIINDSVEKIPNIVDKVHDSQNDLNNRAESIQSISENHRFDTPDTFNSEDEFAEDYTHFLNSVVNFTIFTNFLPKYIQKLLQRLQARSTNWKNNIKKQKTGFPTLNKDNWKTLFDQNVSILQAARSSIGDFEIPTNQLIIDLDENNQEVFLQSSHSSGSYDNYRQFIT